MRRARWAAVGVTFLAWAAFAPAAAAEVRLNEVNCEGSDWVELVNPDPYAADISSWLLTDDPLDGTEADHRYTFPSGSAIPAGDRVVVERGDPGFPFGVSCGADTLRLADGGGALVDEIAVPALTDPLDTWGRYPDATGSWVQTASTKGRENRPSTSTGEEPGEDAAWLFDPGKVVGIDLSLPQASREALADEPTEYQPGTVSLTTAERTYGPMEVGIRLKGGRGSFQPLTGKAAFKVKFNHSVAGQRFFGIKTLTLNNMVQDPTGVHEVLAYEAFRGSGVAAPRTGYAYVRVDGEEYGLYLNLETWDDVALGGRHPATRHLFEAEYGVDVMPGQASAFELEEGPEDLSDLERLIQQVHGAGDFSERVAAVADLEQMTRMWAVEKYIGHWDGYSGREGAGQPNNYFLHSDPAGRFTMLPWGTDQTWLDPLAFDSRAGELFDRCLADASCLVMYRQAVSAVARAIAALNPGRRVDELLSTISSWQARDPRGHTADIREPRLRATRSFIARRPADAQRWLHPPGPPPQPVAPDVAGGSGAGPALTLHTSLRARNSLARVLRRGLRVRTRCSRPCRVVVQAMLPRGVARRVGLGSGSAPVRLGRKSGPSLAAGARLLTVRFGKRSRRAMRRLRSTRVAVEIFAVDASGRLVAAKRSVRLAR